jgi:hypothetical protein
MKTEAMRYSRPQTVERGELPETPQFVRRFLENFDPSKSGKEIEGYRFSEVTISSPGRPFARHERLICEPTLDLSADRMDCAILGWVDQMRSASEISESEMNKRPSRPFLIPQPKNPEPFSTL